MRCHILNKFLSFLNLRLVKSDKYFYVNHKINEIKELYQEGLKTGSFNSSEISRILSKFNDDYILAGCSGLHEVKLFDMNRDQ